MQHGLLNAARTRRHPLRQSIAQMQHRSRDDNDLRLFALSFTAFFVCFYTFIV